MNPTTGVAIGKGGGSEGLKQPPAQQLTSNAHEGPYGASKGCGWAGATSAQRLVRRVQQQALLWVCGQRLAAHQAEQLGIKQLHLGQEHAKLTGEQEEAKDAQH